MWLVLVVMVGAVLAYVLEQQGAGAAGSATPDVMNDAPPVAEGSSTLETGAAMATLRGWAEALYEFESGNNPNSLADRNNNPGNLKYAGQKAATGADDKGFAVFSSFADGMDALVGQLNLYVKRHPDWSLIQMMSYYLGGDPNAPKVTNQGNPMTYASYVAGKLGTTSDATLGQLFG